MDSKSKSALSGTEANSTSWGVKVPVDMDTGPNKKWVLKGINYN